MAMRILIDSNVYLRFYEQKSSGFKMLLDNINVIKDDVFVTKQIRDEVFRNKLDVAIRSIKEVADNLQIKGAKFPEGFKEPEVLEWNRKIDELSIKEKEIIRIGQNVVNLVAESRDTVSNTLSVIFSNAKAASSEQITKAKERKDLGNPPGKRNDPVGDQLTWIQLLDEIGQNVHDEKVFIISYDEDFYDKYSAD